MCIRDRLIGSHCEIVLHSLQDLKCSAIRIANGEHTGRKIGSLITDLALRMLHDMTGADSSVSKCYFTRAKSGVLMKSLTIAIRNREPVSYTHLGLPKYASRYLGRGYQLYCTVM